WRGRGPSGNFERTMWRVHTLLGVIFLALMSVGGLVSPLLVDPDPPPIEPAAPAPRVTETVLERRDTLESALARNGVARAEAREILAALRGTLDMRRLRPGERLLVSRAEDGRVIGVTH